PPVQFVSSSAQQSPIQYYGAPAMSSALVSYAPAPPHAFHSMTLQNPNWNMNTGASSHLADNTSILTSFSNSSIYSFVFVGNCHSIPVTHTGHSLLHTSSKPLHLNHILVIPHIIKNLISVRQFTCDNDVSVEFDAYGFSVKDYQTGRILLPCDSTGDLYPATQQPSSQTPVVLLSFSKHDKLSFYNSKSSVDSVLEIIHSDIWTSPILSESRIKYYVIFLDHFSHFVWVYPLHKKSDLFDNFVAFRAYVNKQFNVDIKALQCDHGEEYDNTRFHEIFLQNGIQYRFSCPRTSQQNGKSERILRTINNLIRTLLFQAHIPPSYWVEALNMLARLLNILPSTAINNEIPFTKLYNQTPTYEDLHVFGCLCYPHVDASHKLEPRFTPCIFLGYPANHRGYQCLDLASNKIIISRHVRFDEDVFLFENVTLSSRPPQHDTPPSHSSTPILPQPDIPPSHSSTPIPTSAQTQSHAQTIDSHTPIPINNSSQTMSTHPMVTRAKAGIFKPLERMNCHVTTNSPLPRSYVHALRDPHWKEAMLDEYNALVTEHGYKACLIANGRSQQQDIDCDETFSLVVKPATIRTVLSLAIPPPGFVDPNKPGYVCQLQRSFYGLKQAPRAWFQRFASYATGVDFQHTSSLAFLQRIIASLHSEFTMTDLSSLNYFLGISAQRSSSGLFLSQLKFVEEILERAHMHNCNPCWTRVDTESKLGLDGDPVSDPTLYPSLAGALQYLTFTHPNLSYAVQQVCLYMHDPRDPHFTALKRILRYVRGTLDYGLQLHVSSTTQLNAYTDADWAGCPVTR
nr:ribonuclease H-like domain-containing protein [Tanacetum cinerariifolium]